MSETEDGTTRTTLPDGSVLETRNGEDGLSARWIHDVHLHGPWQATAPGWAVREFAKVKDLMRSGKWSPPVVVSDMGEGHLVHCDGLWDDGELICPPERDTYYEATVKWSNGTVAPLVLWNEVGLR